MSAGTVSETNTDLGLCLGPTVSLWWLTDPCSAETGLSLTSKSRESPLQCTCVLWTLHLRKEGTWNHTEGQTTRQVQNWKAKSWSPRLCVNFAVALNK